MRRSGLQRDGLAELVAVADKYADFKFEVEPIAGPERWLFGTDGAVLAKRPAAR